MNKFIQLVLSKLKILMDLRFLAHNTHLDRPDQFSDNDPHLRSLKSLSYVYRSNLLKELSTSEPGIYSLSGGRQIGKTTLLKQWMADLLNRGINAENIVFFTGELIEDHHSLVRIIQEELENQKDGFQFILLDEISYIRNWDKGLKFLADSGQLEKAILILTGSDASFIKEARVRFPGRRGKADVHDFTLFPLSFLDCLRLKKRISEEELRQLALEKKSPSKKTLELLFSEFANYLIHGGYLTAINDMAAQNKVLKSTLNTYSDWIRGDFLKRGKQEGYLQQIVRAIIKRYGSQITWNNLTEDLAIDHPKTVADYISLLESMDAAYIQSALVEDKLLGAPKKAKKLVFTDPFIFHALNNWIYPTEHPYEQTINPFISNPKDVSKLVEGCVVSHFRRFYETYYIKSTGEIDIAYIHQNKFWPVEIKWTNQLRPKDLKQIMKYPNSKILAKTNHFGDLKSVPIIPLPVGLIEMEIAAAKG